MNALLATPVAFPSARFAVLCGVRGGIVKRLSGFCYPQRYCSGLSLKGIEVRCLMPFCMFALDWIDRV